MTRYAPAVSIRCVLMTAAIAVASLTSAQTLNAQQTQQKQPAPQQIKTLAIVNGQEISRQQVANECMRRFGEDTLESIINKFLVASQCQQAGISITEKDVNDEIIARAKKFGMSADRYIQTICGRRNITPNRFKNDFVWNELALRRLAAKSIQVTQEELSQRMEFEYGGKVQVRQIVVNSLQQANQIQKTAAANPADFERIAKKFSVDLNSQSMGGLLPPIRRNAGLPELENLAFSLKPGEVSRVLPIAEKFVILKCERIFPAEKLAQEQITYAHDRLIEQISNEKLSKAAADIFKNLQKTTKIVNVMNDQKMRQQMPGVAALVNNRQILINSVAEDCITRFGTEMLKTEINRSILLQALSKKGLKVEDKHINAEIARAADNEGYLNQDGTVNVNQWLAYVTGNNPDKVSFYKEDQVWPTVALKLLVQDQVKVTQEDLQKGFAANFGPRVEVLAVVANDHRTALKVWKMANANPKDAKYFGQLANTYSIDPMSKNNFGEIPPIRRHSGQGKLETEVFKLKTGEISNVIQVGEQWLVMYCKGRTEPVVTDLDAVKQELYKDILEKKMRIAMAKEFQQLMQMAQIDNFLAGTSQPGASAVRAARASQSGLRRKP